MNDGAIAAKGASAVGKTMVYAGVTLGALLGGYLPVLLGAGALSLTSFVGGTIGGFVGLWAGYKAYRYLDL